MTLFALIFSLLFSSLPSRHGTRPPRYTPRQDLCRSHLLRSSSAASVPRPPPRHGPRQNLFFSFLLLSSPGRYGGVSLGSCFVKAWPAASFLGMVSCFFLFLLDVHGQLGLCMSTSLGPYIYMCKHLPTLVLVRALVLSLLASTLHGLSHFLIELS